MTSRILVGTSGWSYRHWRGVFYPSDVPAREWLSFYATRFDTVELNTTFYRTPSRGTVVSWRDHVPQGFVFAVKASRYITHLKRLNNADETVQRQMPSVRPLGAHLGPTLVQLPEDMGRDLDRLRGLLEALPEKRRFAIEFRNDAWDDDAVYELLARHRVGVCLHDWRRHPWPPEAADAVGGLVYVRLHGPSGHYAGSYDERTLETWASLCHAWRAGGSDVFCYFNNDADGNAVGDAMRLRRLLGEDPPELPGD